MKLTKDEGKELIKLARSAVLSGFSDDKFDPADEVKEKFSENLGCFVTINMDGELRGCIGFVEPVYPLWEGIINAAKAAAFQDPRFEPMDEDEFKKADIEVSVLTKPEEIKAEKRNIPKEVKVGRDGLIVEFGGLSGLLLPQVFTEYNADSEKALDMTCQKAGLSKGCWKEEGCRVLRFEAKVFRES